MESLTLYFFCQIATVIQEDPSTGRRGMLKTARQIFLLPKLRCYVEPLSRYLYITNAALVGEYINAPACYN